MQIDLNGESGSNDVTAGKTLTEVYQIVAPPGTSGVTLLAASGTTTDGAPITIPAYGSSHPHDSDLKLKDKQHNLREFGVDQWIFEVTCNYTNTENELTPVGGNPLNAVPVPSWRVDRVDRVYDFDAEGTPMVNAAGMPFDPPIVDDEYRLILSARKNIAAFDALWALSFLGKVNSQPFKGAAPHYARCIGVSPGEQQYLDGIPYMEITFEIAFSSYPFVKQVYNMGYYELVEFVPDFPELVQIKDSEGVPVSSPKFLQANGEQAPLDFEPTVENGGILEFEYPKADLNMLGI